MKLYNWLIKYRLAVGVFTLALAIFVNVTSGFWPAFILYFGAIVAVVSHFLIGPLRLVQDPMERGDIEAVEKILNSIWFPNLLIKPIRSTYYTLKGNLAMMKQDYTSAEAHLKKSNELGAPVPEAEGANKLQIGMMAMQRGDFKAAESNIRAALRSGIPDKESEAVAYLGMVQIFMNKREFRAAKDFYRKAKACNPKQKQVVDQIKQLEKYISRIPG
ncbi:MAG: tetratricopeptide repeat protein [Chitinophagaceae bacterium]|jgi:tetratricopeptide (TPR) repeat protein